MSKTYREHQIEDIFREYKRRLIQLLGRKALYDYQIDEIARELFGSKWLGCNAQDKIVFKSGGTRGCKPLRVFDPTSIPLGYQIINVDTSNQPGSHWCALIQNGNNIYVYDSFARSSQNLLKVLTKSIRLRSPVKNRKIQVLDSDRSDSEQRGLSQICGHLCIAWLMCAQDFGVKSAMKI